MQTSASTQVARPYLGLTTGLTPALPAIGPGQHLFATADATPASKRSLVIDVVMETAVTPVVKRTAAQLLDLGSFSLPVRSHFMVLHSAALGEMYRLTNLGYACR